jgi:hypothetical protein
MQHKISLTDELRVIYQEIIEGVSASDDDTIFFRHLTELDNIEILRKKIKFYKYYLKKGLPSEEDRLAQIIQFEEWSQDKEDEIINIRFRISDNEKNIPQIIPQMQAGIRFAVEQDRKALTALLTERYHLLGATADEMSNRDTSAFSIYLALFSDRECKRPLFPAWESFDALENEKSDPIREAYDKAMDKFEGQKIRQLSVMPFFLNSFSYSKENVSTFIDKPMVALTSYQMMLFSLGQRNLSILSNSEGSPPEFLGEVGPNEVLTWYDQQYSIILTKRKQK